MDDDEARQLQRRKNNKFLGGSSQILYMSDLLGREAVEHVCRAGVTQPGLMIMKVRISIGRKI